MPRAMHPCPTPAAPSPYRQDAHTAPSIEQQPTARGAPHANAATAHNTNARSNRT